MTDKTLQEFTEALASRAPVPGGGGASALVGALAASLGEMVAALTLGKPRYAAVQDEIAAAARRLEELRADLLALIARDAEAFEPLSRAYGIPAGAPERAAVLEAALNAAAGPPLEMLRLAAETVPPLEILLEKGSALAVSDAGVGAAFAAAAMRGAALNVFVNTGLMADGAAAAALNAEADVLLDRWLPRAEAVTAAAGRRVRKGR